MTSTDAAKARVMRARRARAPRTADRLGDVTGAEQQRLARDLGGALHAECARALISLRELPARSGVSRRTVEGLRDGLRRPSLTTCWRLGKALALARGRGEETAAAIAARLADAAGESLRDYGNRRYQRRDRMIAEARAAAYVGGVAVGPGESVSDVASSILEALGRRESAQ